MLYCAGLIVARQTYNGVYMSKYLYNVTSECFEGSDVKFHNGRLLYTTLETYGNSIEDCIFNATIGIEDWHGNEQGHRNLDELNEEQILMAEKIIRRLCVLQDSVKRGSKQLN